MYIIALCYEGENKIYKLKNSRLCEALICAAWKCLKPGNCSYTHENDFLESLELLDSLEITEALEERDIYVGVEHYDYDGTA